VAAYRGYVTIVLLNLAALGIVVWQLRDPRVGAVAIEPAPTSSPVPEATEVRMHVYVSGAVKSPDVVILGEAARAHDAIAAAGGFAASADRSAVNLAQPLADGQQLHVPATGEPPGARSGSPPMAALVGSGEGGTGSGASGSAAGGAAEQRINVNRATAAELETLPGIGPALAERIIAHREANGAYEAADDLLAVAGIGTKTLARFRDRIAVH
jgi:competence protein ComEA